MEISFVYCLIQTTVCLLFQHTEKSLGSCSDTKNDHISLTAKVYMSSGAYKARKYVLNTQFIKFNLPKSVGNHSV